MTATDAQVAHYQAMAREAKLVQALKAIYTDITHNREQLQQMAGDALDDYRHVDGGACTCTERCDDGLLWDADAGEETEIVGSCECRACHEANQ